MASEWNFCKFHYSKGTFLRDNWSAVGIASVFSACCDGLVFVRSTKKKLRCGICSCMKFCIELIECHSIPWIPLSCGETSGLLIPQKIYGTPSDIWNTTRVCMHYPNGIKLGILHAHYHYWLVVMSDELSRSRVLSVFWWIGLPKVARNKIFFSYYIHDLMVQCHVGKIGDRCYL